MCWGAAAREKNGSTTSKRKTVSDIVVEFAIRKTDEETTEKSPSGALALNLRRNIRQVALDTTNSFRDGP
jgi:hypothetical protein